MDEKLENFRRVSFIVVFSVDFYSIYLHFLLKIFFERRVITYESQFEWFSRFIQLNEIIKKIIKENIFIFFTELHR